MSENKKFKCSYCGRYFIKPVPHKCNGSFRKRKLVFNADISSQIDWLVMPNAVEKPPLGVMPHIIWLEKRITELSRAFYEYTSIGIYDNTKRAWLYELYNLYHQRERYLEEHKGVSA